MPDDFVVNVKQIFNYPLKTPVAETDLVLLQESATGGAGAYRSTTVASLVSTALQQGGFIHLAPGSGIAWNGAALTWNGGLFSFSEPLDAPGITVGMQPVATQQFVTDAVDALADAIPDGVTSFNFRTGDVQLETPDILRAGGAPIRDAHFGGFNTSPTPWNVRANTDQIATTSFVQHAICWWLQNSPLVQTFNGRTGTVILTADDITAAATAPGAAPQANSPALGDASNRIATTLFVDESLDELHSTVSSEWTASDQFILDYLNQNFLPIASGQATGVPTAPTAAAGTNSGQVATTAFVHNAVVAATAGVASFNTRTGAVTLTTADITGAGGAPVASPALTGIPTAPTAAPGTSNTQVATTAFVNAALGGIASGVITFNTRAGAVTLTLADVTGTGVLQNTPLTGMPTAPTAPPLTNNTQLATTAFVAAAIAAMPSGGVSSFNGRVGAVTLQGSDISAAGGALLASPNFTGTPQAPTAANGTNSQQIATTAFVMNEITSLNFAPLNSPAFVGVPSGPTAAPGTNTGQLATTAYVMNAIASSVSGVASFNGRTGAVTLQGSDVVNSGALDNTTLTGIPVANTATPGTSTAQLATTMFVQNAVSAAVANSVTSFNSRVGAVNLQAADVSAVGGALLASPTFTGTPAGPTATPGTNSTQLATTAFVMAAIGAGGGVTTFNGRAGAVTLSLADVTGTGVLANTPLTGTPTAPTPVQGDNSTKIATTAFVAKNSPVGKQTIWVPAAAMTPRLTSGPVPVQYELPNYAQIRALEFSQAGNLSAQFEIAMPKGWDLGNLTFIPVWSSPIATGAVVWYLAAVAVNPGNTLDVTWSPWNSVTSTTTGANTRNIGPESAPFAVLGAPVQNTAVIFVANRTGGVPGDTLASAARLHGMKIMYTTNAANDS